MKVTATIFLGIGIVCASVLMSAATLHADTVVEPRFFPLKADKISSAKKPAPFYAVKGSAMQKKIKPPADPLPEIVEAAKKSSSKSLAPLSHDGAQQLLAIFGESSM